MTNILKIYSRAAGGPASLLQSLYFARPRMGSLEAEAGPPLLFRCVEIEQDSGNLSVFVLVPEQVRGRHIAMDHATLLRKSLDGYTVMISSTWKLRIIGSFMITLELVVHCT